MTEVGSTPIKLKMNTQDLTDAIPIENPDLGATVKSMAGSEIGKPPLGPKSIPRGSSIED